MNVELSAEDLRVLLTRFMMSQTRLANELGVRPETVCRWSRGRTKIPNPTRLAILGIFKKLYDMSGGGYGPEVERCLKQL